MVNNMLTQKDLGKQLGLSPPAITKLRRQGMPVDSVEAARAWRLVHVRPHINFNAVRNSQAELAALEALWPVAQSAIDAGRFDLVRPALQAAMRAIPKPARHLVLVDLTVMDALCSAFAAEIAADVPLEPEDTALMSDEEADAMGGFWYCVAAGEPIDLTELATATVSRQRE